ncbi:MAG: TIGR00341 family protein [Stygiobacter sp.]|jgi:uncharacterized hydrophobic protein (TIGR00271 family)|uniref:TIGR00341 family protein n=1 Tax=Stygiobacter electus TaxID=3032292 RepID=A0AAE3P2E6_9BACT|nr:TIGR00341 family protein [Stygiobacter electus]MDF1612547.1 TIGR00341 family protein [Stygiobacter electus]
MSKFKILRVFISLREFVKERFNLDEDKASEKEVAQSISKGVEFKGTNLWVLIFAIIVASVGLNVNSTAVIIGAMLISPLMGPIMGIGFAVAIYDFELIKKAFKNLSVAVIISVITSTLYFLISPLGEAQSELLARTTPTIWDVMIALFGGLAGIVAVTRKHFSNVIPGVAIATALMPPLCTAGFGLASGNFSYFIGAFYLFFINSVFISLATLIIVRFLRFHKKEFVDEVIEKKVKRYIFILVFVTVVPSIYMAYNIVSRSILEKRINDYIANEIQFENTKVVSKNVYDSKGKKNIEIFMVGKEVSNELTNNAINKKNKYGLDDYNIIINQTYDNKSKFDINVIKSTLLEDLYKKNEAVIKNKDLKISFLENQIQKLSAISYPVDDIYNEAKTINNNIKEFFITKAVVIQDKNLKKDTLTIAYIKFNNKQSNASIKVFNSWLKTRVKSNNLKLFIEK